MTIKEDAITLKNQNPIVGINMGRCGVRIQYSGGCNLANWDWKYCEIFEYGLRVRCQWLK